MSENNGTRNYEEQQEQELVPYLMGQVKVYLLSDRIGINLEVWVAVNEFTLP